MHIFKTISSILHLNIHEPLIYPDLPVFLEPNSWVLSRATWPSPPTRLLPCPKPLLEASDAGAPRIYADLHGWDFLRTMGTACFRRVQRLMADGGGSDIFRTDDASLFSSWRESSAHWKYCQPMSVLKEVYLNRDLHGACIWPSLQYPTISSDPSSCQLFMKPCWASYLRPIYSVHQSCNELLWASLRVECSGISHTYCVYLSLPATT